MQINASGLTLHDFWSWAYSDILSNRNRSVFAEFLVGCALGIIDKQRIEWDAYDFKYKGKKIEVKSAAYLQSWNQLSLSIIRFDISKKKSWHAETNTYEKEASRQADCYVFCLYPEKDRAKANVLEVNAWEFYVVPVFVINRQFNNQKSAGLKSIQNLCEPVKFDGLKGQVDKVLSLTS